MIPLEPVNPAGRRRTIMGIIIRLADRLWKDNLRSQPEDWEEVKGLLKSGKTENTWNME